ncbi:MAG: hypothetical protein ACYCSO_00090 [Cuniculiplasma sp.]
MKSNRKDQGILPDSSGNEISPTSASSPFWTFRKSMKVYFVGAILGTVFSILSGIYFGGLPALFYLSTGVSNNSGTVYLFLNRPIIAYAALPILGCQMIFSIVFFLSLFKMLGNRSKNGKISRIGLILLVISYVEQFLFLYSSFLIASGNPPPNTSAGSAGSLTMLIPILFLWTITIFLLFGLIAGVIMGTEILAKEKMGQSDPGFPFLVFVGFFFFPIGIFTSAAFFMFGSSRIKQSLDFIIEQSRKFWAYFSTSKRVLIITAISGFLVSAVIITSCLLATPVYDNGYFLYFQNSVFQGNAQFVPILIGPFSELTTVGSLMLLFKKKTRTIHAISITLFAIPLICIVLIEFGVGVLFLNWGSSHLNISFLLTLIFPNYGLLLGGVIRPRNKPKWNPYEIIK